MTETHLTFFSEVYAAFLDEPYRTIRRETFGQDIGQNSWLTANEYREFLSWLGLHEESRVLEVASGSGGPALFMAQSTGCRVVGVDIDPNGVNTAGKLAAQMGLTERAEFQLADASQPLPYDAAQFDAVLCIDSMNHLIDRPALLREWYRLLKPGGRILYTDPVIITGPITNHELAARSLIGTFLFTVAGYNERVIQEAGFALEHSEDVTANEAEVAGSWHDARAKHREAVLRTEEAGGFELLQRFFSAVHRLTSERRLSRVVFVARK